MESEKNPRGGVKKLSGVIALGAAANGNADAATVQITLVDNFINQSVNSLNADVTGDELIDLVFGARVSYGVYSNVNTENGFTLSASEFAQAIVKPYASAAEGVFFTGQATSSFAGALIGTIGQYASSSNANRAQLSVRALYPITFEDPRYGGSVNAWLDIEAGSPDTAALEAYVQFNRVIWDDTDLANRPAGLAADASAFEEAIPVPEPSSLALLALGAGGVLARRRRNNPN